LFAIEDEDGNLNKKHRDMFVTVERGGHVWGPCRKCGQNVEWPRDDTRPR
jgi:uncharacterized metal-binding protein YceD (DUF177 family)